MINYTGLPCPVCGKAFQESDDIVVCPECGAPHHRECYAKNGTCALEDKHGTEEDWFHQAHKQEKTGTKQCPRCRYMNKEDALFCKECGQSLHYYSEHVGQPPAEPTAEQKADRDTSYRPPDSTSQGPSGGYPPHPPTTNNGYPISTDPFDPMGGVPPTETFHGVEARDLARLVQTNTRYYLPVFYRMKHSNRSRFSFVAFLFGGGWYLYRKQYVLGIILTAINAAFIAAHYLLNTLVVHPLMMKIDPTIDINSSLYQINEVMPKLMGRSAGEAILCLLPFFVVLCQLGLYIFNGVRANRFYYNHCVKTVKKIKESQNASGSYEQTLRQKGGVNLALAACLLGIYFLANILPGFLV